LRFDGSAHALQDFVVAVADLAGFFPTHLDLCAATDAIQLLVGPERLQTHRARISRAGQKRQAQAQHQRSGSCAGLRKNA
jgi:hypothetical protein